MRCPKCQYISFDSGDRCRNCGYEFSLSSAEEPPVDVKIRRDEPMPGRIRDASSVALDTPLSSRDREETGAASSVKWPLTPSDLPLFTDRVPDDQAPLVTPPAVPRPPLSVRRTNPGPRGRAVAPQPEELSFDLGPASFVSETEDEAGEDADARSDGQAAGLVRRFAAGVIDVVILGAILVTVVYLTLRLSDLASDQWRILPAVPLAAFLLLLCGGYFVLFTAAGGQTIGKMVAKIRVVSAPEGGEMSPRVSFAAALTRALASFGSVLALGAGFLPVFFSADRRAFHDRIAETRVVSA